MLVILPLIIIFSLILFGLGSALTPLIIAFFLAYLFFPIIQKIEHLGIKRQYTVLGVFIFLSLFCFLLFILFVPQMIQDTKYFFNELPYSVSKVIDRIELISNEWGIPLKLNKDTVMTYLKEHTTELSTQLMSGFSTSVTGILSSTVRLILNILNLFLIPLFFFYLINDYEKIIQGIQSFIPASWKPKFKHYLNLSHEISRDYIRGQLLVAGILSLLYAIGLTLIGLKFGFLIGLLSGFLSIIPYAGFTIGFTVSLLIGAANYEQLSSLFGVVAVFSVVQSLEGTLITPKLVGNKVGLSSLTTMLALIIGGNLLGIIGMLIAIPIAAILKNITLELKTEFLKLKSSTDL
jgi:predicted PurR-regulated permease PerM